MTLDKRYEEVTRVAVLSQTNGRVFEQYDIYKGGAEVHIQDEGRTLKVFPLQHISTAHPIEDGDHALRSGYVQGALMTLPRMNVEPEYDAEGNYLASSIVTLTDLNNARVRVIVEMLGDDE